MLTLVPAVKDATTFAVSVTSALASIASNLSLRVVVKFFWVRPPSPTAYVVFVSVEEIVPFTEIVTLDPAVKAATTFAVSVTSAKASMLSSLSPSTERSRPSTVSLPDMAMLPVIIPPDFDNFVPIDVAIVVAKLGSSPNAAANSSKVSNVSGAESTKLATCVPTYVCVA